MSRVERKDILCYRQIEALELKVDEGIGRRAIHDNGVDHHTICHWNELGNFPCELNLGIEMVNENREAIECDHDELFFLNDTPFPRSKGLGNE